MAPRSCASSSMTTVLALVRRSAIRWRGAACGSTKPSRASGSASPSCGSSLPFTAAISSLATRPLAGCGRSWCCRPFSGPSRKPGIVERARIRSPLQSRRRFRCGQQGRQSGAQLCRLADAHQTRVATSHDILLVRLIQTASLPSGRDHNVVRVAFPICAIHPAFTLDRAVIEMGCPGGILQNRSGPFLDPERGCGRAFRWISATMVDHAHSFDSRTLKVRTFHSHAFDARNAGPLRPDRSLRRPNPAPAGDDGAKSQMIYFSGRQVAALFALFACVAAIPVLLHPLPPISDYINHLSRMHVIAAIGRDSDLARFYQVNWEIIPNLMMDMILPVLVRIMSIYAAGQAYMIASFVLILAGTFALNRQLHGRWSVLPLAAFPLLYNYVFLVGTMNYVSGIGLSLWALVAWIALRERNLVLRLTVSTLFVTALFFCHLYALGTYGLGLLAFELHRLWSSSSPVGGSLQERVGKGTLPARLFDFVAAGLP